MAYEIDVYVCSHFTAADEATLGRPVKTEPTFHRGPCPLQQCQSPWVVRAQQGPTLNVEDTLQYEADVRKLALAHLRCAYDRVQLFDRLRYKLTAEDTKSFASERFAAVLFSPEGHRVEAIRQYLKLGDDFTRLLDILHVLVGEGEPTGWAQYCVNTIHRRIDFAKAAGDRIKAYYKEALVVGRRGEFEATTYDHDLGVEELRVLRNAGEQGARILNSKITDHSIRVAEETIEAVQAAEPDADVVEAARILLSLVAHDSSLAGTATSVASTVIVAPSQGSEQPVPNKDDTTTGFRLLQAPPSGAAAHHTRMAKLRHDRNVTDVNYPL